MQDLKRLSRQKRRIGFRFFSLDRSNRDISRCGGRPFPRLYFPTGKQRVQLKRLLVGVAIALALIPVSLLVYQKTLSLGREVRSWMEQPVSTAKAAESSKKLPVSSFVTAYSLLEYQFCTACPLMETIVAPRRTPAAAAELSGSTSAMSG